MSSGLGIHGHTSRCFFHYRDYTVCLKESDDFNTCLNLRNDYLECLHQANAVIRRDEIREQEKINKLIEKGGKAPAASGHGGGHH